MSGTPELDYFMNNERSDVRFMLEGQSIPALKSFLSVKSRVFHTMFSGEFKESKEVVIEDTTYYGFKNFIRFLYCDDLVLKNNDFKMVRELYRLSKRYEVSRLENRITDLLSYYSYSFPVYWYYSCVSDEDFQSKWLSNRPIARIAFEFKITKLEENVMTFIRYNFDHFLKKDSKELSELNDLTDGRLIDLMANKCRSGKKASKQLNALKKKYEPDFVSESESESEIPLMNIAIEPEVHY